MNKREKNRIIKEVFYEVYGYKWYPSKVKVDDKVWVNHLKKVIELTIKKLTK